MWFADGRGSPFPIIRSLVPALRDVKSDMKPSRKRRRMRKKILGNEILKRLSGGSAISQYSGCTPATIYHINILEKHIVLEWNSSWKNLQVTSLSNWVSEVISVINRPRDMTTTLNLEVSRWRLRVYKPCQGGKEEAHQYPQINTPIIKALRELSIRSGHIMGNGTKRISKSMTTLGMALPSHTEPVLWQWPGVFGNHCFRIGLQTKTQYRANAINQPRIQKRIIQSEYRKHPDERELPKIRI